MNGCEYSSGIRHSTALLLAIFLGWAGADRFYLGYYAIGLFIYLFFIFAQISIGFKFFKFLNLNFSKNYLIIKYFHFFKVIFPVSNVIFLFFRFS